MMDENAESELRKERCDIALIILAMLIVAGLGGLAARIVL